VSWTHLYTVEERKRRGAIEAGGRASGGKVFPADAVEIAPSVFLHDERPAEAHRHCGAVEEHHDA
jgi:hypothetical protein